MNPFVVGMIVFACTFGGALLGMWLRAVLPEHHLDPDSKDTVKIGMGLVVTMTALVLGLVTASAKSSFDAVDAAMKQTAIEILTLDRDLARYGPETGEIRRGLQHGVGARIDMIWPQGSAKPAKLDPIQSGAAPIAEGLADAIRSLKPRDDAQRALQSRALDLTEALLQVRWLVFAGTETSIPLPFLVILLFWMTIAFVSFGLFAPRNATVLVVLFVCALSVGSAVFLIMELDRPFDGVLSVSADPLRYAYSHLNQFLDGSAYLPHVERVRRARGAEVPAAFYEDPLMYQAVSAGFLGPRDPVAVASEDFGIDLEAEVLVVTDDVPMGTTAPRAMDHIQLVGLVNDVSLRHLIPAELAKGFGFLQSKPRSALSPVLATPYELGDAWRDGKVHLPLRSWINGDWFGAPEAGEDMQFIFAELIAHAARTRPLAAGTLVGSGTVANQDEGRGASCLAERRVLQIIAGGEPRTPFLRFGDRVRIEMLDAAGRSIFGAIEQDVVRAGA